MISTLYVVAHPSICPSHRWISQNNNMEVSIKQFSPYGGPTLVFAE